MKFFSTQILLLFTISSFAQDVVKGHVFSAEDSTIVPYATIRNMTRNQTVDADETGYFEIQTKSKNDSLLITSIGFKDDRISIMDLLAEKKVFLEKNYLAIDPVVVKTTPVIKTFGILNKSLGLSSTGGNEAVRAEMTTLIQIPKGTGYYRISKILIKGKKFSPVNPVRLHIYSVNNHGLPGEELLRMPVILNKEQYQGKNIIAVDVRDQNIFLDDLSFFVGVQWMSSYKIKIFTGPEIIQTYKVPEVLSYYRQENLNNNAWFIQYEDVVQIILDEALPPIGRPGKGNPLNMCASAEIEVFPK